MAELQVEQNPNDNQCETCPLCSAALKQHDLCEECGSLEGFEDVDHQAMAKRPGGRTFGFAWQSGSLAPFKGSPPCLVDKAVEALRISREDYVVELGCGDGRVALKAAKGGATVVGVELDAGLLERAVRCESKSEHERKGSCGVVEFIQQDIRRFDLSRFNVVIVFLLPSALDSPWLSRKLLNAVESGARVLSFAWPVRRLKTYETTHSYAAVEWDPNNQEIPVREFFVYEA